MSDTPAPPAPPEQKQAKTTTTKPKSDRGIFVVFDENNSPRRAYSGEIDALRYANDIKGSTRKVLFGDDFVA